MGTGEQPVRVGTGGWWWPVGRTSCLCLNHMGTYTRNFCSSLSLALRLPCLGDGLVSQPGTGGLELQHPLVGPTPGSGAHIIGGPGGLAEQTWGLALIPPSVNSEARNSLRTILASCSGSLSSQACPLAHPQVSALPTSKTHLQEGLEIDSCLRIIMPIAFSH